MGQFRGGGGQLEGGMICADDAFSSQVGSWPKHSILAGANFPYVLFYAPSWPPLSVIMAQTESWPIMALFS